MAEVAVPASRPEDMRWEDSTGRTWLLEPTLEAMRRIRRWTGCDLIGPPETRVSERVRLMSSPERVGAAAYCLCEERADRLGLGGEEFGKLIDPDNFGRLQHAVAVATAFFLRGSSPELAEALTATARETTGADSDEDADATAEKARRLWRSYASASGEPSESTPAPSA